MNVATYLLKREVYARKDASPNPELNEVSTTPKSAIHSELEYATRRNPANCNTIARNIRTLKRYLCYNVFLNERTTSLSLVEQAEVFHMLHRTSSINNNYSLKF